MVTLQEGSTTITDSSPEVEVTPQQRQEDLQFYLMSWIWRAVECLVDTPDFNPSPKWIAQRLGISVEKAVDAIEGLERLGRILPVGRSFKRSTSYKDWGTGALPIEDFLKIHSVLAPQIMSKINSSSKFSTWFFAGDQNLVAEFAPRFAELYREMVREGQRRGCKSIIASEISFSDITSSAAKEGSVL